MGDTFGQAAYHVVFSTKNRYPWLEAAHHQRRCWRYMEAVAADHGSTPLVFGGTEDHMHLLFDLWPAFSLSEVIKQVKGSSSTWIKQNFPDCGGFSWQPGYGYFVVPPSGISAVRRYIENQWEHHKTVSFKEEYKKLLEENDIKFEEKYLF